MPSSNCPGTPAFAAVTSCSRQLYSLLKCIAFSNRAQIQISSDGLRITVEDSRVMQAHVFIDKNIFNNYSFNLLTAARDGSELLEIIDCTICFEVSLTALIECLQIFGAEASREKWATNNPGTISGTYNRSGPSVFDQQVLRIGGTCCFSYTRKGSPLCLTLQENGIFTTCQLATSNSEYIIDIPIARDSLEMKIIMKANWLYDAVQELETYQVDGIIMSASPSHPFFSLSATGSMGSTVVEFSKDRSLLETFQVPAPVENMYKFSLLRHALKAMAISSRVSIRGDSAGVLSLQFMIEHDVGSPSFIDFRFLPSELD